MLDSLRRSQIGEVLNYDRNMNLQVISLERRAVANMNDDTDLYAMQNQTVLDTSNKAVAKLTLLLDKKRAAIVSMQQYLSTPAHERHYATAVTEIYNISEAITSYNECVTFFLANNSPQTRQMILASVRTVLSYVSFITAGLKTAINAYIDFYHAGRMPEYIRQCFSKVVMSFCAFDLIEEQLRSSNIYVITHDHLRQ